MALISWIMFRPSPFGKGRGQGEGFLGCLGVSFGIKLSDESGVFHPHLNPLPPQEGEEEMMNIFLVIDVGVNLANVLDL